MPRKHTLARKTKLVAAFGGGCQQCGYNRSLRALQFHHIDAREKYEWSRGNASFDEVETHPERFELLCANCHFERHEAIDQAKQFHATCLYCGERFPADPGRLVDKRARYCSRKCQHLHRAILVTTPEVVRPRFYRFVQQGPSCWDWAGYMAKEQTPIFELTDSEGRHRQINAARVAYWLEHGVMLSKYGIVRACGNPRCVRLHPDHARPRSSAVVPQVAPIQLTLSMWG